MQTHHERGMALVLTLFFDIGAFSSGRFSHVPLADGNLREHELPQDVADSLRCGVGACREASGFLLDTSQFQHARQRRSRSSTGRCRP